MTSSNAFYPTRPVRIRNQIINEQNIDVYENKANPKNDTPAIIFFTGLNSAIPSFIYKDFLKTLSKQNITTYIANSNQETTEDLIDCVVDLHPNVTFVAHSSGCVTASSFADNKDSITDIVFLDPVDNFFMKNLPKPNLKQLQRILVLNAKRSYEWTWDGLLPSVPFIPAFKLEKNMLRLNNPETILLEAEDYGHTDILSKPWSDFMHNSLSRGTALRSEKNLRNYRLWLATSISHFVYNQPHNLSSLSLSSSNSW